MPSTFGSKLSTLQRISLLLNPKTVITRNALSNMLINPVYAVRDFAASGMDKALSKKTGLRTIAAPNYKDQAKGWKKGVFESYDDFRRAVNTRDIQANRYEISNKLGSGPAFKGKNPLSKAIAFLDRTTGFLLDVGDRPFFEGYFLESLNRAAAGKQGGCSDTRYDRYCNTDRAGKNVAGRQCDHAQRVKNEKRS